ncbi:MAG: UDP-N-acetylglucosamine--dolichyl-phosphate N-acetylglucosaminephosphotransferase [Nitrososphaerales archaeon]
MINAILAVSVSFALTVGITVVLSRFLSVKFKEMGITGVDVHKPDKPVTAEMGGLAVLVGVAAGASFLYELEPGFFTFLFFAGLLTILLVGVVGLVDDLISIRQRYKPFVVALMTIPLAVALFGRTELHFPLIGSIPFGILYPLLVVPLGVTTSANLSNMLAGFNGLEAGCAAIGIGTLTLLSALEKQYVGFAIGTLFLAGYIGFLALNWYPARIFPGDTGTLMAGAAIATIGLISGLVFAAVVVSLPAALDFTLKMLSRNPFSARKIHGNTIVTSDGTLRPPNYAALSHVFMRVTAMTERSLVKSLLLMEGVYAVLAVLITVSM